MGILVIFSLWVLLYLQLLRLLSWVLASQVDFEDVSTCGVIDISIVSSSRRKG